MSKLLLSTAMIAVLAFSGNIASANSQPTIFQTAAEDESESLDGLDSTEEFTKKGDDKGKGGDKGKAGWKGPIGKGGDDKGKAGGKDKVGTKK